MNHVKIFVLLMVFMHPSFSEKISTYDKNQDSALPENTEKDSNIVNITVKRGIKVCNTRLDIGILLDGSGSIGYWKFVRTKKFLQKLVSSFVISPRKTRVGIVVTYGYNAALHFGFDQYENKNSLVRAIGNIGYLFFRKYPGGGTSTGRALRYTKRYLFRPSGKSRRVLIVLTDDYSSDIFPPIKPGMDLPELQEEPPDPIVKEVGLRGDVLTGESTEAENDLIRYSNYISGAGSTFGGFMSDFPQTVKDLTEGLMASISFKHDYLAYKLKKGITVDVLRKDNAKGIVRKNVQPEIKLRLKRTGTTDVSDTVISNSYESIKNLPGVGEAIEQKKLTQQNFVTQKKLGQYRGRLKASKLGDKIASRIGFAVEGATTGFTVAQGAVDYVAGADIIDKARELRASGGIKEDEYHEMMRNGRFRVAQGSFGLASGMKNVMTFAGKRIEKKVIAKVGAEAAKELLGELKRFGSVVGSAISLGTSITSIAKNIMAAKDALKEGQTGKAVVYAIMATIDTVTTLLDGASLVMDVVFPPVSAILDVISTILQVFNTILGFFADLFDFQSTEDRVKEEFEAYISSKAFKDYVNNMADSYRKRNFDLFFYYVDAEVAGISADPETLRAEKKKFTRCLTKRAEQDFDNKDLRIAIIDATKIGKKLEGRFNDDEILAGFGPDQVYGCQGDDILFGRGGGDSIFGGPGHDYLNGGTGRDILLGEEGDDILDCEPGVDETCKGGKGRDMLEISGPALIYEEFFNRKCFIMGPEWEKNIDPPRTSPVKGIYLNIAGQNGISLGSAFQGWPGDFSESIHKPAFDTSPTCNLQQKFIDLFNSKTLVSVSNVDELKNKVLWYMVKNGEKKYFCDGASFYEVTTPTSSMRVARDAISTISKTYAQLDGNDRLMAQPGQKKLEALLAFAFRKSFDFDKFIKFSAGQPNNLEVLSNYIPTTFIGNNEDNVIDVSFGHGDMVFTGEGNNVISIGSTINDYWNTDADARPGTQRHHGFHKWAKYVVGGSGEDTLVIQYMPPPQSSTGNDYYGQWMLRNINRTSVSEEDINNNHVVYLKNIETVEVRAPPNDESRRIRIDAKHYDGATRYIIDKATVFFGPTSTEKGLMVLPRSLSSTSGSIIEFGPNTKSTLSFKYYEDETKTINTINIHQESEHDNGYVTLNPSGKVWLKNVMNVISFSSCETITGNNKENMIIAEGGTTTIHGKEGDDTLVSGRGVHTLIGGEGADTYVLQGPDVVEYLTISVNMGRDGRTISCSTTIYGVWNAAQKTLEIDVLRNDHENVLLNTVEIIPGEGDEGKNLGTISKDSTNRKLIYLPESNFNDLHRLTAKVVRIKYTTKGSMARIDEKDYGNELRIDSIASFSVITATIENNKLVIKNKANPPQTIFIDEEWGNKLIQGVSTNLLDLILDFANRFPVMLLKINDQEFNRMEANLIMYFLYQELKGYETDLNQDFDTFLDSTTVNINNINVGNGANIVLAKTRGKTYTLGPKSSGSIIFANQFTRGSGNVLIDQEGRRCDRNVLNTLVVGVGSGGVVDNHLCRHNVIVTGALMNEVQFKCGDTLCIKDSQQNVLINSWRTGDLNTLLFKKSDMTQIIVNAKDFLEDKLWTSVRAEYPIIVSHGKDGLQGLNLDLPFNKDQAAIEFNYERNEAMGFLWIYFKGPSDKTLSFWRKPYLVIESSKERPSVIHAQNLINAVKTKFKAGIKFADTPDDQPVKDAQLCEFVIEKSREYRSSRYSIDGIDEVTC